MTRARVVIDTNVLVSRLILPQSLPAQAVRRAEQEALLLISEATMYELADVLARPRFDRYVSLDDRKSFLRRLGQIAEFVWITQIFREWQGGCDCYGRCGFAGDASLAGDCDHVARGLWPTIAID